MIRISGAEELRRKFATLGDAVAADALASACRLGAEVVRTEAARLCPVRTGNLRASLTTEVVSSTRDRAEVAVGPGRQAPYGKYVEFGTSRMRAQPYLRPALDANGRRAAKKMGQALRRIVLGAV